MTTPIPPFATFDLARFRRDLRGIMTGRGCSIDRLARQTGLPPRTVQYLLYSCKNPSVQVVAVLIIWSQLTFEDYIRIA